jgi:hypothetical protein
MYCNWYKNVYITLVVVWQNCLFLTYIQDPDPHSFEKLDSDPDPHSPKKLDPYPHKVNAYLKYCLLVLSPDTITERK